MGAYTPGYGPVKGLDSPQCRRLKQLEVARFFRDGWLETPFERPSSHSVKVGLKLVHVVSSFFHLGFSSGSSCCSANLHFFEFSRSGLR